MCLHTTEQNKKPREASEDLGGQTHVPRLVGKFLYSAHIKPITYTINIFANLCTARERFTFIPSKKYVIN